MITLCTVTATGIVGFDHYVNTKKKIPIPQVWGQQPISSDTVSLERKLKHMCTKFNDELYFKDKNVSLQLIHNWVSKFI